MQKRALDILSGWKYVVDLIHFLDLTFLGSTKKPPVASYSSYFDISPALQEGLDGGGDSGIHYSLKI